MKVYLTIYGTVYILNVSFSLMSGGTGGSNAGTTSSGTGGSGSGKRSIHSSTGGTGGSTSVDVPGKSGISKQMNMFLRTKSDSGKRLSDAVRNGKKLC